MDYDQSESGTVYEDNIVGPDREDADHQGKVFASGEGFEDMAEHLE